MLVGYRFKWNLIFFRLKIFKLLTKVHVNIFDYELFKGKP